ncbi:TIGR01458 family HAD-type hydrolase [Thiomicrorhabdus chilensis]|uniref:TIGR01458 family HAD-type hydrolase n=1 Tax=Thiomicrorhabdus chilensis TaxID=63656 RepID=UPI0003F94A8A|nr:TIGR01458 family HAD-type hydrolase [Thiomicrorhabdus chilensis]
MNHLAPDVTLANIKALLLDLSGVLYEGEQRLPGADSTLQWLRNQGYTLRFVTNTASESRRQILSKLKQMGLRVEASELFSAPQAAKNYLLNHQMRPFCILHPNLKEEFLELCSDSPNCVLLGDAQDDLNYANLNQAFRLLEQGMPFFGIGKNKYFMNHDGLKLDAGAFIHALEWASGTEAVILGKPDAHFFAEAVRSTGLQKHQCLMVGDDVESDVQGAIQAGLQACLVKTGKFKNTDLQKLPQQARLIETIKALPDLLSDS